MSDTIVTSKGPDYASVVVIGSGGAGDTKTIHVVSGGKITDAMLVPAAAVIADKGVNVSWDGTTIVAPAGSAFAAVDGGAIGYGWDGKTVTAPLAPPAPSVDLTAYAASARYAKETAGITVGTAPIATDRASQSLITGMWAAAQINPNISVSFKSGSGFVVINAAQIAKIAAAVVAHVQACFSAEAQVVAGIAASPPTITSTAQIDAAFGAVTA